MADKISLDESMRQCLRYFKSAVHSVAKSPEEIFEEYGEHLGVAWELRQELLAGKPLLEWSGISIDERNSIEKIIRSIEAISPSALESAGLRDLANPSWDLVRKAAREYIGLD